MTPAEAAQLNSVLAGLPYGISKYRIMVDTFHQPYIQFPEPFVLPQVKLHDTTFEQARTLVELLARLMPGVVSDCHVLPESRPLRDSDQLHLVRPYRGGERDFIFIFKLQLKNLGGIEEADIVTPGSQGVTSAFRTDRLYFTAQLFPVKSITETDGYVTDFRAVQIKDAIFRVQNASSGKDIWSAVLFDDVDFSKINRRFSEMLGHEIDREWKLPRLFWPFVIDYLSLCVNLVSPERSLVDRAHPYFDRVFSALLPGVLPLDLSDDDQNFWRGYYDAWAYESISSRSGNPHWFLNSRPDSTLGLDS